MALENSVDGYHPNILHHAGLMLVKRIRGIDLETAPRSSTSRRSIESPRSQGSRRLYTRGCRSRPNCSGGNGDGAEQTPIGPARCPGCSSIRGARLVGTYRVPRASAHRSGASAPNRSPRNRGNSGR
ncbi:MAG: hypothetical protein IVW54_02235 [Candidatus Binataceae bacterium]|nr:hypothetical protein [Candidatus Binataceae bacterium]